MTYCIQNKTREPVSVLGFIIEAGGVTRQLSQGELTQAWSTQLPEGVFLVPLLMEVAAEETSSSIEPEASVSGRRRRPRKESEIE